MTKEELRWRFIWRVEPHGDYYEQVQLVHELDRAIKAWSRYWDLKPEQCVLFTAELLK